MTIDKDSNEFKEFSDELKQKLNSRLYDKITAARQDVAGQMVGEKKCDQYDEADTDDDPGSDTDAEYDALVARELKKAGKEIKDMTPDEKKAFFAKLDKMHTSDSEEAAK